VSINTGSLKDVFKRLKEMTEILAEVEKTTGQADHKCSKGGCVSQGWKRKEMTSLIRTTGHL
jgi:hypothetical protein